MKATDENLLRRSSLFQFLTEEHYEKLRALLKEESYDFGDLLVKQGDPADAFYVLASGREGLEQASDAVKTLAEAKSPTEFFQIQSELARASFDRFVANGSKLTERVVKLAGEAAQPLQNRASINAERINDLVA